MLRASVSLSRKVSREFNSTGYTVRLDGEVPHQPDDAEAVLVKVSELFQLAEEALAVEMERDQKRLPGVSSREAASSSSASPPKSNRSDLLPINRPASSSNQSPPAQMATPKQLQYLQSLSKQKGFSRDDLDAIIVQALGSAKRTGELTRREAGQVIDHLTKYQPEESR